MSERYVITHSLISSWTYLFKCYESVQEKAYEDFKSALFREEQDPTEAMLDGQEFENLVYHIAAGNPIPSHKWSSGAVKVAEYIRGAPVQIRIEKEFSVSGMDFVLHGVLDSLKGGVIYDVKYSVKPFSSVELAGKYLESSQHPAYFFLEQNAGKFVYLVSDGEDLYTEEYLRQYTPPFQAVVSQFINSIDVMGLLLAYKKHWKLED